MSAARRGEVRPPLGGGVLWASPAHEVQPRVESCPEEQRGPALTVTLPAGWRPSVTCCGMNVYAGRVLSASN